MQNKFDWLVTYADADPAGIIYHANYLSIADRARTSWFYDAKIQFVTQDYFLVVRNINIRYKASAKLLDKVCIISRILNTQGSRIYVKQEFFLEDKLLCDIDLELVCVDAKTRRPLDLPSSVKKQLDDLGLNS